MAKQIFNKFKGFLQKSTKQEQIEGQGHYAGDENEERGNWSHPMEFIMSSIGVNPLSKFL